MEKSTPIVFLVCSKNTLSMYLDIRLVFPTPEFPTKVTLKTKSGSYSISIIRKKLIIE